MHFSYILILGGYAVAETCGNGVDCCDVCSWYGGRPTDCVAFLFGNNERQRAEQHCRRAHSNPNYCYSGYCIKKLTSYEFLFDPLWGRSKC